jgi:hypothetical protein
LNRKQNLLLDNVVDDVFSDITFGSDVTISGVFVVVIIVIGVVIVVINEIVAADDFEVVVVINGIVAADDFEVVVVINGIVAADDFEVVVVVVLLPIFKYISNFREYSSTIFII